MFDEFDGDFVQMIEYFHCSSYHVSLVICEFVLLAKRFHEDVDLLQVVTWEHWE